MIALVVCVALVCVTAVVLQRGYVPPIEIVVPEEPPADSVESRMRERLLVTLKSGEAFAGVLWEADERVWVLRSAEAVTANSRPVPVDGELVLLTASIAYANKP